MDTELKIQILLCLGLVMLLVVCFMVIINSIGNIGHIYDRLEEIVNKETVLRFQTLQEETEAANKIKQEQMDKERRQKALADVELEFGEPADNKESE